MSPNETLESLKNIIKPYSNDAEAFEKLSPDTDFISDLKINSANLVDIALDVEEAFGITIDNESMEKMLTVKAAMEIIGEKLAEK